MFAGITVIAFNKRQYESLIPHLKIITLKINISNYIPMPEDRSRYEVFVVLFLHAFIGIIIIE